MNTVTLNQHRIYCIYDDRCPEYANFYINELHFSKNEINQLVDILKNMIKEFEQETKKGKT